MTAYLVECPACHVSFPVDRETMRVIPGAGFAKLHGGAGHVIYWPVLDDDSEDRCNSQSCGCNRPEPAA